MPPACRRGARHRPGPGPAAGLSHDLPSAGGEGRPDRQARERARGLLTAVGLEGREHAHPDQLSGGQQQRVALARALAVRPRLLLADEPTGSLDSTTGAQITELMLKLAAEHGTTVVIATHDDGVAAACDRIVRVNDGRLALS
ncbi:ABC transporter ATP-binding protein [Kitasatospora sp. NPDC001159]